MSTRSMISWVAAAAGAFTLMLLLVSVPDSKTAPGAVQLGSPDAGNQATAPPTGEPVTFAAVSIRR